MLVPQLSTAVPYGWLLTLGTLTSPAKFACICPMSIHDSAWWPAFSQVLVPVTFCTCWAWHFIFHLMTRKHWWSPSQMQVMAESRSDCPMNVPHISAVSLQELYAFRFSPQTLIHLFRVLPVPTLLRLFLCMLTLIKKGFMFVKKKKSISFRGFGIGQRYKLLPQTPTGKNMIVFTCKQSLW